MSAALLGRIRAHLSAVLRRETSAFPVQLFRIAVGVIATAYFIRLLGEVRDFSALDGLIDHSVVQGVYPETRVSLFQAGTPALVISITLAIALTASVGIIVGWRTKMWAALALVIAASTYRWNFIVMYLDDAVVHLMIFWLLLLPVDPPLRLMTLVRDPRGAVRRWIGMTVPGTATTCLLVNVALMYALAGLWKFDSPLWRSGYGLYAALRLPIAAMPEVWEPGHVPLLRAANWMVMAIEPLMALPLFLPPGHRFKAIGGVLFAGFHLFILITLGLPFAMFGLLSTLILFFGPEITAAAARWSATAEPAAARVAPAFTRSGQLAIAFVLVLFLATTRHIPVLGTLNVPAYGVLWLVGVAQDYRLFNWIDRVNFDVKTHVFAVGADGTAVPLPAPAKYPSSFRSQLLLAYLHDIRWLRLPQQHRWRMRTSIAERLANWYCVNNTSDGAVRIMSDIFRLVPTGRTHISTLVVADFECRAGRATIRRTLQSTWASPEPTGVIEFP